MQPGWCLHPCGSSKEISSEKLQGMATARLAPLPKYPRGGYERRKKKEPSQEPDTIFCPVQDAAAWKLLLLVLSSYGPQKARRQLGPAGADCIHSLPLNGPLQQGLPRAGGPLTEGKDLGWLLFT